MNKIQIRIVALIFLAVIISGCSTYRMTSAALEIRERLAETNIPRKFLMEGSVYQTPAYIFESGKKGPAVLVLGGTHGDEPAGYEAALRLTDYFIKNPLLRGAIIIIPEANRQAVLHYNRRIPVPQGEDIERGNLNRCYPGKPNGLPMEQLARQIQNIAEDHKISVLIDLHEALYFHLEIEETANKKGLGQTLIYYPNEHSSWLVMNMLDQINSSIDDNMKKFSALERPIPHSASWWAGNALDIAAFTFETSRKNDLHERIAYHIQLVQIVLRTEKMIL
jgi:hypothetical protein